MDQSPIFHLATGEHWDASCNEYRRSTIDQSLEEVGFIHCSTAGQIQKTADRYYRGRSDVILLKIDPGRLGAPLRYEEASEGELFPHVYGPIPVSAVISATPLRLDEDGCLIIEALD